MWAAEEAPFREVQGCPTSLSGNFCLSSNPKQLHLVFYCYSQLIIALLWFEFGQKVPSSHFFLIFLFLFLVWQWILATYSINQANISIQYYYIEYSIWNHCYYVHTISCSSLCFWCLWFTVTRRKNFRKLDLCI